ncbi:MAG: tetratricopeptide repeat protein [Acidobacteriaceae bacterium]
MLDPGSAAAHRNRRFFRIGCKVLILAVAAIFLPRLLSVASRRTPIVQAAPVVTGSAAELWPISVDYPEDGSIFPPGITPPTFLWRDGLASYWNIDIQFADGAPPIHTVSKGERMHLGPIDPDCVSDTNELPRLSAQQAASWVWTPDAATWQAIQSHSTAGPATLTITGYKDPNTTSSQGHITFTTSVDPVGAPIFYRDVPLMPSAGANGTVQPLSPSLIHLIRWRLKDITSPESHTVLTNMPTCANCHSFSRDGKTMGIDVDGPANDKGLYALVPVQQHISIQNKDVVQWNTDGQAGKVRVGFMSQVSPDGQYVVSTFAGTATEDVSNTYYVTNFKDYRFLQVFYPTRGILEWYSRATGKREPLPGADDPRYVQTDGVWSPDGKDIVFARADAVDPYPVGEKKALRANDPNETSIQYNLYRVPFNDGKGGTPEPIAGASNNGMSNNFPKVSPDGRWIVFVQCHNGQLMRPDSQLYIVPFEGGVARRLRANTPLMNSWHSFSPNGRWLVFSSKARSPYTQMYLTHLDNEGNSSPPILIDNATASNRAVNLPEFVNIAGDGIAEIQVPAVQQYKLMDEAMQLEEKGENDQALGLWKQAVAMDPENAKAQNGLGISLYVHGDTQAAFEHLHHAVQINPLSVDNHYVLGKFLLEQDHADEAVAEFQTTVSIRQHYVPGEEGLGSAFQALGDDSAALAHWRRAHTIDPSSVSATTGLAWLLATAPDASVRNGTEALSLAENANRLAPADDPDVFDALGAAWAENGQFTNAIASAKRALDLAVSRNNAKMAAAIRSRLQLYEAKKPFRETRANSAAHKVVASMSAARGQP